MEEHPAIAGSSASTHGPIVVGVGAPNILVRLLWFLFVGWWLGAIVSAVAWVLIVLIIPMPVGLWLINRLPTVITLRPQESAWRVEEGVLRQGIEQRPFVIRALYFLVVGWWLSALWLAVAWGLLSLWFLVVTIPLAFWMYGRIGAVTTLYRS